MDQTELIRVHKYDSDFVTLLSNLINDHLNFTNKVLYINKFTLTFEEQTMLTFVAKETNYKVVGIEKLDITNPDEFVEHITGERFTEPINANYFNRSTRSDLIVLVISTILYFKKNFILLSSNERFRVTSGEQTIHDDFIQHFKNMYTEHNPERYENILVDDRYTMCVNLREKSIFETDGLFLSLESNTPYMNLDTIFYYNVLSLFPTYSFLYFYDSDIPTTLADVDTFENCELCNF